MSALSSRASDHTPLLTGGTDPFLYNPRRLVDGQVSVPYVSADVNTKPR